MRRFNLSSLTFAVVAWVSIGINCAKVPNGVVKTQSPDSTPTPDVIFTSDTFSSGAGAFGAGAASDALLGGTSKSYVFAGSLQYSGNNTVTNVATDAVTTTSDALIDTSFSQCQVIGKIVTQPTVGGLAVHASSNGTSNKYLLVADPGGGLGFAGQYALVKVAAGSATVLSHGGSLSANDTLKLGLSGTSITATVTAANGTVTDLSVTDSSPLTDTKFGLSFVKVGSEPDGEFGSLIIQNCL